MQNPKYDEACLTPGLTASTGRHLLLGCSKLFTVDGNVTIHAQYVGGTFVLALEVVCDQNIFGNHSFNKTIGLLRKKKEGQTKD